MSELNQNDRVWLRNLRTSPSYKVLVDLIETKVRAAETDLLRIKGSNVAEIQAAHNRAQAFWELFEAIQKDIAAVADIPVESTPMTPMEIILAQHGQ